MILPSWHVMYYTAAGRTFGIHIAVNIAGPAGAHLDKRNRGSHITRDRAMGVSTVRCARPGCQNTRGTCDASPPDAQTSRRCSVHGNSDHT